MKAWLLLVLLVPGCLAAQQKRVVKFLEDKNLYEATYYHENGQVSQQGTFNLEGALHGTWTSYSESGKKIAIGAYQNGKKDGKWFFWEEAVLREVDYNQNAIAAVQEWKEGTRVAVNR